MMTAELQLGQGSSPKRKIHAIPANPAAKPMNMAAPKAAATTSASNRLINA